MENMNNQLKIVFGDVTLGVSGNNFRYLFSYQKNGLESLVVNNKEWLYREPRTAFWRATTDNDRGYNFSTDSAVWLGADLFPKCVDKQIKIDGTLIEFPTAPNNNQYSDQEYAKQVEISYIFETNTIPSTIVTISYHISEKGNISVTTTYTGKENLPSLPAFGLRFVMPTKAKYFEYQGLSGETYPDRIDGGKKGQYRVEGLPVTPYLVPQECGMHMETEWVKIIRDSTLNVNDVSQEEFSLLFKKNGDNFAFSCLPYTPFELENAYHQDELPIGRRTVLTIYGCVRGVGGIDSWGSGIEETYEIPSNKNHRFSFEINIEN